MISTFTEVAVPAFATLFVIIDPIGLLPLFMAMTAGLPDAARRAMAWHATLFGFAILLVFALVGQSILSFLGISLPAFRIAGGLLLFLTALEMLFEKRAERREKNVEKSTSEHTNNEDDPLSGKEDLWVFPLGTPLIAGPGAIASVILLMGNTEQGLVGKVAVVSVLAAVLAITFGLFLIAGHLNKMMGPTATRAMTRILGMILAALAVQFVLTGLTTAGFGS